MAVDHESEEGWQNAEQANWRGLALTDPIKTIQVRTKSRSTHTIPDLDHY